MRNSFSWAKNRHLLGGPGAQGSAYFQDGPELGRAPGALALVLAQAARVEGVAAEKVHRRQLQRAPAQRAAVVLEHPHLRRHGSYLSMSHEAGASIDFQPGMLLATTFSN